MIRKTLAEAETKNNMLDHPRCQIFCVPEIAEPMGNLKVLFQRHNRVKRILRRRCNYVINYFKERAKRRKDNAGGAMTKSKAGLKPGDIVRIKSREEIQFTLDRWGYLRGCGFMEEMLPYCGTAQRIFKKVERFLDERDYLMKKCTGVVTLDGVLCSGTKDFGPCDRSCYFFWRVEWLGKVDEMTADDEKKDSSG